MERNETCTKKRSAANAFKSDADSPNKSAKLEDSCAHDVAQPGLKPSGIAVNTSLDSEVVSTSNHANNNGNDRAGITLPFETSVAALLKSTVSSASVVSAEKGHSTITTPDSEHCDAGDAADTITTDGMSYPESLQRTVNDWFAAFNAGVSFTADNAAAKGMTPTPTASLASTAHVKDAAPNRQAQSPLKPVCHEQHAAQEAASSPADPLYSPTDSRYPLRDLLRQPSSDALIILARFAVRELEGRSRGVQHNNINDMVNDSYDSYRVAEIAEKKQSYKIKKMLERLPLDKQKLRSSAVESAETYRNYWNATGIRGLINHGPHNNANLRRNEEAHGAAIIIRDFGEPVARAIANKDRTPFVTRNQSTNNHLCTTKDVCEATCLQKHLDRVVDAREEGLIDITTWNASRRYRSDEGLLSVAQTAINHATAAAQERKGTGKNCFQETTTQQKTHEQEQKTPARPSESLTKQSHQLLPTIGQALQGSISAEYKESAQILAKLNSLPKLETQRTGPAQSEAQEEQLDNRTNSSVCEQAGSNDSILRPQKMFSPAHEEHQRIHVDADHQTGSENTEPPATGWVPAVPPLLLARERRDTLTRQAIIQRNELAQCADEVAQVTERAQAADIALRDTESTLASAIIEVEREQTRQELEQERAQMQAEMNKRWAALEGAKKRECEKENDECGGGGRKRRRES